MSSTTVTTDDEQTSLTAAFNAGTHDGEHDTNASPDEDRAYLAGQYWRYTTMQDDGLPPTLLGRLFASDTELRLRFPFTISSSLFDPLSRRTLMPMELPLGYSSTRFDTVPTWLETTQGNGVIVCCICGVFYHREKFARKNDPHAYAPVWLGRPSPPFQQSWCDPVVEQYNPAITDRDNPGIRDGIDCAAVQEPRYLYDALN